MTINLYFFRIEITVTRSRWTPLAIRKEVAQLVKEGKKLDAIKRYRELMNPMPTLVESKAFVDSLSD